MQKQSEYIYLFVSAEVRSQMEELSITEADLKKAIFSFESDDKVVKKDDSSDIHIGSFISDGRTIFVEYECELDEYLNMGSIFTVNNVSVDSENDEPYSTETSGLESAEEIISNKQKQIDNYYDDKFKL